MKAKENKEKIVKLERIRKKRKSLNEDVNKYDDVFIKMPVEEPVNKKLKVDRPKTVKTYQAKFRSTAVRILQESGNFIDAFVAAPTQPLHRKKKAQSCKSPTTTPPKLQFYKDTLEMANETTEEKESETKTENAEDMEEKSASVDSSENKSETVINDKITEPMDARELDKESREQNSSESSRKRSVNGQLCSILTHDKRREKKKSVRWAEESDLKQIYYFEMDETERVNVYREHLKSIEIKQERKAFEHAQRLIGDKMEESIPWMNLIRIDLPAPLVERGCNSKEKEIQMVHQQSTLQDIYFSRERLPVTPHELKQESVTPQEPKIIPLEEVDDFLEESNPSSIIDFSALDLPLPKPEIPSVLSNLIMSIANPDSHAQPPSKTEIPSVLSNLMMSITNSDSHDQPPPKPEIPSVLSNLIMSIANPDSHAQPPSKTEIPSVLSNLMMSITNPDSCAQPPPKPEIPSMLSDPMISIANPDSHPQPPPKPEIPSVLSNLMMSITNPDSRAQPPTEMPLEHVLPSVLYPNHHSKIPVSGGGHVSSSVGLLGSAPPGYEPIVENHYTNDSDNLGPDWDSKGIAPDQYSDPFYQVHRGVPARNIRIPPSPKGIRPRMLQPPPIRGPMPKMQRGRGLRLMGPPQRKQLHILCRNFRAGTCKYGKNCNFLHPGLNGPPL